MDGIVNISNPRGFKFCIYLNTKISMPHEQTINNASKLHSSLAQNTRNINMNVCIEKILLCEDFSIQNISGKTPSVFRMSGIAFWSLIAPFSIGWTTNHKVSLHLIIVLEQAMMWWEREWEKQKSLKGVGWCQWTRKFRPPSAINKSSH